MPISEDAIAIVASNLTAARCSLIGGFAAHTEERARSDEEAVERIYTAYLRRLAKGNAATHHQPSS